MSLKSWPWWGLVNSSTPDPALSCFESLIQGPWKLPLWLSGAPRVCAMKDKVLFSPLLSARWPVAGECRPGACSACARADPLLAACPSRNQRSWEPATPTSAPSLWKEVKLSSRCCSRLGCLEFCTQQTSPFRHTTDLAYSFINGFFPDFQIYSNSVILTASLFTKWALLRQTWEYNWHWRF